MKHQNCWVCWLRLEGCNAYGWVSGSQGSNAQYIYVNSSTWNQFNPIWYFFFSAVVSERKKKKIDMYDCQHVSDYIHDISSSCLNLIHFKHFESAVCVRVCIATSYWKIHWSKTKQSPQWLIGSFRIQKVRNWFIFIFVCFFFCSLFPHL